MPPPKDTLWPSQPRTFIKHQVYRHYLQCWMGKICRTHNVACVVDAFAGPGEYTDGLAGSPVVIAETFLKHSALGAFNTLRLICLEARSDRRDHLITKLGSLPKSPKLELITPSFSQAARSLSALANLAHPSGDDRPTLWILDPFGITDVPFTMIRTCLAHRRDEVLVTWFADEIYRFCEDPTKSAALSRHFGGDHWQAALSQRTESGRKQALLRAYQDGISQLPDVLTNVFSISTKNETARYSLVFATHSDKGLECFNPVGWRMDPVQGRAISEKRGLDQGDLFEDSPITTRLRDYLRSLAGKAVTFRQLLSETRRLGFLEKHLRASLDEMAEEFLAVREEPLKAKSSWPADSLIRFYPPPGD